MNSQMLLDKILSFMLLLYANPALPRKIVQIVFDFVKDFIETTLLLSIEDDVIELLTKKKCCASNFERC